MDDITLTRAEARQLARKQAADARTLLAEIKATPFERLDLSATVGRLESMLSVLTQTIGEAL